MREMQEYKLDLLTLQEVSWKKKGRYKIEKKSFTLYCGEEQRHGISRYQKEKTELSTNSEGIGRA